jgi:gliding motility-associated-like protein
MHTSGQGRINSYSLLILFLLQLISLKLTSQAILCNGNLGDNIFTKGDFGTGNANVVATNPGYAPGFVYTTNVPPDDGEYTITNDMRLWSSIFPAWIRIGDNDLDPKGYMMVVNASFSPGIFYEELIDNLCENTLYEFSADIINIIRMGTAGHIKPNVSFLLDGVVQYTTGQIPQDEEWHTYGFTFTTGPGQFSIKLTLQNNAPGGIGNDLALDNISFKPCGPESSVSISPEGKICENSLFPELTAHIDSDTGFVQWQISTDLLIWTDIPGETLRTHQVQQIAAGKYYFRYLYSNTPGGLSNQKCRIVSDIILVEVVPVAFTVRDTICEGLSVELGGIDYSATGTYQQLFTASNGCDSLVTLELLVVPDPHIEAEFGASPASCEGASDGSVFLVSVPNLRPPFTFRVDDSIVPPPTTLIHLPPGTYTAWIETPYGCFDNQEVVVEDGPQLDVQTSKDTTIVLGHTVWIHSTTNLPVDSAGWTNSNTLSCPSCLDTYATPVSEMTTYVITVKTDAGCEDSDSITIRVDRTPIIYIPNVFSPNFDGINDYFSISTDPLNVTSINRVTIFDRWGGIIAEKSNLATEQEAILWDGGTPAGPAMPGTYVYLIEFTMADNSHQMRSGDVTVVR